MLNKNKVYYLAHKCPKIDKFYENEMTKVFLMAKVIRLKFNIPELKEKLLLTGDEELIEGNYWKDTFWGVCDGVGKNWLGELLMNERGVRKMFYDMLNSQPITISQYSSHQQTY